MLLQSVRKYFFTFLFQLAALSGIKLVYVSGFLGRGENQKRNKREIKDKFLRGSLIIFFDLFYK